MEASTISTLASASPYFFRSASEAAARIEQLETQLGISPGKQIFNIGRANVRIKELEKLAKTAVAAAPAAPAAASTVQHLAKGSASTIAALEQFAGMQVAERDSFSEQGGAVSIEAFNSMPIALRVRHHALGGRIVETNSDKTARAAGPDPCRQNAGTMRLSVFTSLGENSRIALLRHGLRLSK